MQKLVDAGAVILGKTNMHELAFGISGYNEGFFTAQPIGTRNPYDRTRIAGGSSSGTGAAIGGAAGARRAGQRHRRLGPHPGGADAAAPGCGPTLGRYSQEGVTPISHSRDTVGPMAQTVADVALLDSVITGRARAGARVAERREARRLSRVLLQGPRRRHARRSPTPRSTKLQAGRRHDRRGRHAGAAEAERRGELPGGALRGVRRPARPTWRSTSTGKTVEQVAADDRQQGREGHVRRPRRAAQAARRPTAWSTRRRSTRRRMEQARPALLKHFADTFQSYGIDALVGADHAARRRRAGPGSEQPADLPAVHPEHRSRAATPASPA